MKEETFQTLPLDEQKQMVLEMLDLNQMYISANEMDDEMFEESIPDEDKRLTRVFYGNKL